MTVNLGLTTAQATGGSGSDTLLNFENLTGSNYHDRLTGNAAANTLSGGLGSDQLNGAAGADRLIGGDGSDLYYVDNAGDIVSETNAAASTGGIDTVYSSLGAYTLTDNVENLRLLATGAANGTGNSLNNVIDAAAGNNILNGGAGIDTASYAYATAAVTVNLGLTTAQATGGSGSDTLLNFENLTGSNYNDKLTGNAAANTLIGGAGNDTLTGGAGNDLLIGGTGLDKLYDRPVDPGRQPGDGGQRCVQLHRLQRLQQQCRRAVAVRRRHSLRQHRRRHGSGVRNSVGGGEQLANCRPDCLIEGRL
ncbi:hypothetical protein ASD95_14995 [Pseudomonas sp. Root71]|nr:calcium-binding protein [Pseudomonas sp. Root71]KRB65041.1 hypothetical protein ASD95_14995 [Pseudomonas sp. Root71]